MLRVGQPARRFGQQRGHVIVAEAEPGRPVGQLARIADSPPVVAFGPHPATLEPVPQWPENLPGRPPTCRRPSVRRAPGRFADECNNANMSERQVSSPSRQSTFSETFREFIGTGWAPFAAELPEPLPAAGPAARASARESATRSPATGW